MAVVVGSGVGLREQSDDRSTTIGAAGDRLLSPRKDGRGQRICVEVHVHAGTRVVEDVPCKEEGGTAENATWNARSGASQEDRDGRGDRDELLCLEHVDGYETQLKENFSKIFF